MTTKPKTRKTHAAPRASAPNDAELTAGLAKYLHYPARAAHLESLEEHLVMAARLSRALWELLSCSDFPMDSKRSAPAAKALADAVADHASAPSSYSAQQVGKRLFRRPHPAVASKSRPFESSISPQGNLDGLSPLPWADLPRRHDWRKPSCVTTSRPPVFSRASAASWRYQVPARALSLPPWQRPLLYRRREPSLAHRTSLFPKGWRPS
jgi:hypothetical protein